MYKYCVVLSVLMAGFSVGVGLRLDTCPDSKVLNKHVNEVKRVQKSVRSVFSKVLNDSIISNASLSSEEVYERIATRVRVSATSSGFVRFQEAVSEVTVAKLDACSSTRRYYHYSFYISMLTKRFSSINLTDAKSVSLARKYYGELLCIQDHLLFYHHRKKRSVGPFTSLTNFFDCLDVTQLSTIFGVNVRTEDTPTLAFVVDDTGSMGDEIASVKRIIRSFIRTERDVPFAYILTTFNDPQSGIYTVIILIMYVLVCNVFTRHSNSCSTNIFSQQPK